LKHELAIRRRGVDRLLIYVEVDAAGFETLDGVRNQLAIDIDHHQFEQAPASAPGKSP
jgi:hypothetical protein